MLLLRCACKALAGAHLLLIAPETQELLLWQPTPRLSHKDPEGFQLPLARMLGLLAPEQQSHVLS